MSRVPILQSESPILHARAEPVPDDWFGSEKLHEMISDMADTMDAEPDGVAIAAPQIGLPYRIFLVRYDRMASPSKEEATRHSPDIGVFINPEIIRLSKKSNEVDEGCLSVRDIYGKTRRRGQATVRARDEHGAIFERGGGKVLAQAFQHEIDHLNGVLFTDHATDIVEVDHDAGISDDE